MPDDGKFDKSSLKKAIMSTMLAGVLTCNMVFPTAANFQDGTTIRNGDSPITSTEKTSQDVGDRPKGPQLTEDEDGSTGIILPKSSSAEQMTQGVGGEGPPTKESTELPDVDDDYVDWLPKGRSVTVTTFGDDEENGGGNTGGGGGGGGRGVVPQPIKPEPPAATDKEIEKQQPPLAQQPPVTETPGSIPFSDVSQSAWYSEPVKYVYSAGLMIGTSQNDFSPNTNLTRGMIVTVMHRHAGVPGVDAIDNPFDDVLDGAYCMDAVKWGAASGVVLGYGDAKYGPDDDVTREQLAAILYRYQQFSGNVPVNTVPAMNFNDSDQISGYAQEAVDALTKQGIINGKPGNVFDPQGNATRAEFAAMLYRYLND